VSRAAKSSRSARCKTNDTTTICEDFTGTNVVQIWLACNPPSTNAIALQLSVPLNIGQNLAGSLVPPSKEMADKSNATSPGSGVKDEKLKTGL